MEPEDILPIAFIHKNSIGFFIFILSSSSIRISGKLKLRIQVNTVSLDKQMMNKES